MTFEVVNLAPLNRTLDQELVRLLRGGPGGESRRKVEQKGDRRSRATEAGKGETVG